VDIGLRKLSKSFGKKQILKDITLDIKNKEIVGLVGKSGCGKSTLLKILVGYYDQDKGKILLDNKEVTSKELKKIVGYTTQENSFYDKLTVEENMKYYAGLYNIKDNKKQIVHMLKLVGLSDHKKTVAENISGGMKRRLDFAISLLHDPKVLILDEPTTGLDPFLIEQFWNIVLDVAKSEDKSVIICSHILPEVVKYCTKVAIMENGKITEILDKDNLHKLEERFLKQK